MDELKPNLPAAIEFLERWRPGGPWQLTAIKPDRQDIQTRTFDKSGGALEWLTKMVGSYNLYFTVNPLLRSLNKKAEREDVASLAWLHVDIDPRAGEDIDVERTRALELLTTKLPDGVPRPTCVVYSGGGYQGFWRLEEPLPIGGEEAKYEDAKLYNIQLEQAFGADHCHNVDRIMRLPGTINWPNKKKAAKGRVPVLAAVEFFEDTAYPLGQFVKAAPVQLKGPLGFGGSSGESELKARVSGNVARVADVSELDKWNVPDRIKVIAVQGHHPDETKQGDNSRSMWVFDFCCNMHRCGVPDDIIYSMLTDKDYGISDSVLEKGRNAERYALRQIERAKEQSINPILREFNERFAVIGNMGGKCRVIEEVADPILNRMRLTRQTFDDFRSRWMHKYVEFPSPDDPSKIVKIPAGKWWLQHPNRRYYEHLVFNPKGDVPGAYNLWRGYGVDPKPGTKHQVFLDHTRDVICAGDEAHYQFLINWMARMVQHPELPGEVAIVLRGGMGVGKSRWAEWIASLWGRHSLQVTNPGHLVGNFNAHLRDTIFLFADEAFYAGDKKHENILRTVITERTVMIEQKGVDAEQQPNFLHLVMASNNQWVVPAGMDERRYFILDVSNKHKGDHDYFKVFMAALHDGGAANLLHYLLNLDISEFNVRQPPKTEALKEQKLFSMSPEDEWWLGKLEAGAVLPKHQEWETEVTVYDLQRDYYEHMKQIGQQRRATPTALGRFLSRALPSGFPKSYQRVGDRTLQGGDGYERVVQQRMRYYGLATLDAARAQFEERFGFKGDWLTTQPALPKSEPPF